MAKNIKTNRIILNKTPLRLSFGGGGTELPIYYEKYGGCVINTAINLFVITKIEKNKENRLKIILSDFNRSKIFSIKKNIYIKNNHYKIHLAVYKKISELYLNNKQYPIIITSYSDAPIGSGLGTSSTLTVSLIKAMTDFFNIKISKFKLASVAFDIERNYLKLSGGLQDHFSASYGGINKITANLNKIVVKKQKVSKQLFDQINNSMLLIYTGISRDSGEEINKLKNNIKIKSNKYLNYLHFQKKNVYQQIKLFNTNNIYKLFTIVKKSWSYKNKFLSNKHASIKNIIKKISFKGVYATKISGAGNGGFLFCLCNPLIIGKIKKILKNNRKNYIIRPSIYNKGSHSIIISNDK